MNMTIGCPIPGASQQKEPVRLIDANNVMQNVLDEIRYKESLYTSTVYSIAKKAIDSAPTVHPESLFPAVEWISVKDRLPEAFDEVIVYFNGFISIAWRETEKRKNGIVGWHWDSQMHYPESLVNVTHWMPLPEPPKETHND